MSGGNHIVQVRTKLTLEVVPHACEANIPSPPYFNVAVAIFVVIAQLQIIPFNIETGGRQGITQSSWKVCCCSSRWKKATVSFVQGGWPNHYM